MRKQPREKQLTNSPVRAMKKNPKQPRQTSKCHDNLVYLQKPKLHCIHVSLHGMCYCNPSKVPVYRGDNVADMYLLASREK